MVKILDNIPLNGYTTLQIGGPAKYFVEVTTDDELIEAIKEAQKNNWPFKVVGGGSNLLVSDEGVQMMIIKNKIQGIEQKGETLKAKAGTPLQKLVDFSIEHNLAGIQTLTGIPGSVGGAVYGNAGAYGQTISDHLTEVVCFDGEKVITLPKEKCGFDYRDSSFKKNAYVILEASFALKPGDAQKLQKETEEIIIKRTAKYPPHLKCPGSFFKNVLVADLPREVASKIPAEFMMYGKIPAGSLLEAVGAKGDHLGKIRIAENHGNTFINDGGGKAEDFYTLAQKYAQRVYEKFGIKLEPEVQFINLPPFEFS